MNKKTFICAYCGKEFFPKYALPEGKIIQCCSKSCKTKLQIEKEGKYKIYNKGTLEFAICTLIKEKERYLTRVEILNLLKVSAKTLSKFKISIVELNKKCGYKKPKSKFEESVFTCLIDIYGFENIERQKYFEDCLSPKEFLLYFDFYIEKENIIIEADGDQHKNKKNPWYSEYSEECDRMKEQYCEDNNIKIIRIPYKKDINIDYIKSFLI